MNPILLLSLAILMVVLALVAAPRIAHRRRVNSAVAYHLSIRDQIVAGARTRFGHGLYAMHSNAVLGRLERERQGCLDFIDKVLAEVEGQSRDMSTTEKDNLKAQRDRVKELDEQIAPLREFEDLRAADAQSTSRFTPTGGGQQDRGADRGQPEGGRMGAHTSEVEHNYRTAGELLADSFKASGRGKDVTTEARDAAVERLRSHGLTVEGGTLVRASAPSNTTTEIPGLLPTPIVGAIMSDVDAARPFISSIGAQDLGQIPGSSFERPTIIQHTQVGKQSAELATVANRQFKVGAVTFTKGTFGGWADVSRQSINWSSPAVWNALMTDFIEQYGLTTENAAADDFVTAVTQTQELDTASTIGAATLPELLKALYAAAVKSYQGSGRLPDTIWASLDWWAVLGPLMDYLRASTAGDGGGDSSVDTFAGNLLRVPRIIVPSFADGTLVVGVKSRTEVYEDRFGFLSVVEPKVFGVQIAYGGDMASGTVKPNAFTKIIPAS